MSGQDFCDDDTFEISFDCDGINEEDCPPGTVWDPITESCYPYDPGGGGGGGDDDDDDDDDDGGDDDGGRTNHTCDIFFWDKYQHDTRFPSYMN